MGDNGNWFVGSDDTGKPSRGEKGEPGSPGAKGDKGDPGATPNLTIGSVTTLEAGQNATASMGGTAESPVLNLGIPRGAKGEPGEGGGGTDVSLGLTSAAVGQIIKVKAIDASGKPTAWEAADMASGGNASTENWKLIRKITVPNDPTTDESGVTWIVNDTGAVTGVEFDTDENGSAFNCSELSITGVGTCAAEGRLDYYAGDTLLCSYQKQQVAVKRYSWVWLRRLGAVWQAVGNTVASWRFIHDMQQLWGSGFFNGPETTLNSVTGLSLRGTQVYNAGYVFEIWGR